ncbi:DUF1810 domain-containing protein [Ramlibacter sp.]|uniref:DUF1810 domain-containing protein n=1 Tax=Ramlibacter sp. TaxID=1917967 RepID=UPI002B8DF463|nr:DUF1810 domain-containing protein [Ramlibacter sp.]HWI82788.1 DUF1810 domain-containing protein [Ramlibacter sp.]
MGDPFDLERFVQAQAPVYRQALAELRAGRKRSHWMWFVFPQLQALGRSATAWHYGLASLAEAQAYWAHPLLGARLRECSEAVLNGPEADVRRLFGSPDDLKFRSCLTLFERVAPQAPVFRRCLDRFYGGAPDPLTLAALSAGD